MERTRQHQSFDKNSLIASDRVEGTEIYGRDGTKLGTVRKVMIDKKSGQVSHALVGYGGILGMGEDFYPVPWDALEYNTDKDGYVVNVDKSRLDKDRAPSFERSKEPEFDDTYQRTVWAYYFPN